MINLKYKSMRIILDLRKIAPSSGFAFGSSELVLSGEEVSIDTSPAEKLVLGSKSKSGVVGALRESSITEANL